MHLLGLFILPERLSRTVQAVESHFQAFQLNDAAFAESMLPILNGNISASTLAFLRSAGAVSVTDSQLASINALLYSHYTYPVICGLND